MYSLETKTDTLVLAQGSRRLRIGFVSDSIARVTFTDGKPFQTTPSFMVEAPARLASFDLKETESDFELSTVALKLVVSKATGAIRYYDQSGRLLSSEPERGGKWLTPKEVYRNVYNTQAKAALGQSIDGARAVVEDFQRVLDRTVFEAKLEFVFDEQEALFGLGSHEEGYGNLRGKSQDLYQQNMKAVVPCLVSTKGYAFLFDCGSLMTFHDDAYGSFLWADVVDELDYYFVAGGSFDEVSRGLHTLTGKAPMLPKWAFGYVQSKERYVNAREMVDVVKEYRRRRVPLDLIVLDWKSWPNGNGWGQKSFDPARFPNPKQFTDELHGLGARLMVSIWPIMTGDCPNQVELRERNLMLGNQSTYDAFQEEARRTYWEQANRGLFSQGIDAWWCDCTEPFEADWSGAVKPERHNRLLLNTGQSKQYLDPARLNLYSLLHSQGIYEGQRRATEAKRVVNLTRSSYAGQHRYATITWSGDVCATWETLRRAIPEGLNFCVTGEPYWTVDIGAFFIKSDPGLWFWRGDYDSGCRGLTDGQALEPDPKDAGSTDLGYHELYVRWLQYGAFLPLFRSHGTDAAREIWRFGEPGTPFYDAIAKYIRLRYQLIPYLYSEAAQVTRRSRALMRPVALAYPGDMATYDLADQYLFGSALMVCPVTQPMYYQRNSTPILDVPRKRGVYLPRGNAWYDFWTEQPLAGGQTIEADAPLETLPLYARAGAIIPLSAVEQQHVDEAPDAPYEIRVYRGADGEFELYEDAGDNYSYENGEFAIVRLRWDESAGRLMISRREGGFPTLVKQRDYRVVLISPRRREVKNVTYRGEEVVVWAVEAL
jgi:alpha-D-xyloside xylohydrolase